MQVRQVMARDVQIVSTDQTLQEAAQLMRDYDIGMLPVYSGNEVIGTITDRDIVIQAVARGLNPTKARVADGMTKNVFTCFEEQDVREAAAIMKERQVRRILVTDRKKHPVGIISIDDLAAETEDNSLLADVMRKVATAH